LIFPLSSINSTKGAPTPAASDDDSQKIANSKMQARAEILLQRPNSASNGGVVYT